MNSDIDAEAPKKAAASLSDNRGYSSEKRHNNPRIDNARAGRFLDHKANRENVRFSAPIGDEGVIPVANRDTPQEYQGRGRHDYHRRSGYNGSGGSHGGSDNRYMGGAGEGWENFNYGGRKNRDDFHSRGGGYYRSGNAMGSGGGYSYAEPQANMSHMGVQQPSPRGSRYGKPVSSNRQNYNKGGGGLQRRPPLQQHHGSIGSAGGGGYAATEQYHDFHRGGSSGGEHYANQNYSNHKQFGQHDSRFRPHSSRIGIQPPPPPPTEYAPPVLSYAHHSAGAAFDKGEMQQKNNSPLMINPGHAAHIYHDYPLQTSSETAYQNKTVSCQIPIMTGSAPAAYAAIPITTTAVRSSVYINPVNINNSGNKSNSPPTMQFNRGNNGGQQQYDNSFYGGRVCGYTIQNSNLSLPAQNQAYRSFPEMRSAYYHPASGADIQIHSATILNSDGNIRVPYHQFSDENHDNLHPNTNNYFSKFSPTNTHTPSITIHPSSLIDRCSSVVQESSGIAKTSTSNSVSTIQPEAVTNLSSSFMDGSNVTVVQDKQNISQSILLSPKSRGETITKDDGWDDGFGGGVSMVDVATLKNKVALDRQHNSEFPKSNEVEDVFKCGQGVVDFSKSSKIETEGEATSSLEQRYLTMEEESGVAAVSSYEDVAGGESEIVCEKQQDSSDATTEMTGPACSSVDESSFIAVGGDASTAVSVSLDSQQPSSDFSNNGAQVETGSSFTFQSTAQRQDGVMVVGEAGSTTEANTCVEVLPDDLVETDEAKVSPVELTAEDIRDEEKESETASSKEVVTGGSSSSQSPQVETPKTLSGGTFPWRSLRSNLSRTEHIERQVKSFLNKITIEKFPSITEKIALLQETTQNLQELQCIVDLVVSKAVLEPEWSEMYADLCHILNMRSPDWGENSHQNFRIALLTKIQAEFQALPKTLEVSEEMKANLDTAGIEMQLKKMKNHILGVVKLIGELFQRKLLAYKIVQEVASNLVMNSESQPHEHYVECFLALISTTGYYIEQMSQFKNVLDLWFGRLVELKTKEVYSKRLKCVIQDVLDLRKVRWKKKIHRDRAMALSDVRGQIEKEDYLGGATHFAQYGNIVTMGKPSNAASSKAYADYCNEQKMKGDIRRRALMERTNNA